jgi:hypothetical protein
MKKLCCKAISKCLECSWLVGVNPNLKCTKINGPGLKPRALTMVEFSECAQGTVPFPEWCDLPDWGEE